MQMEELVILNDLPRLRSSLVVIKQTLEVSPFLYLSPPLRQCCQWSQYEEWTDHAFVCVQMIQESYCLYSLSESHLISQNCVSVLVPAADEPVETLKLERFQLSVIFEDRYVLVSILLRLLHLTF
jgi:hypothetical protein